MRVRCFHGCNLDRDMRTAFLAVAQRVTDEEWLQMGARIRDVEQGPDGAVYLLTDEEDGAVLRLTPLD